MAIQVSPGLVQREIDLSLYVPSISVTNFGIVGVAHKGDMNVVTDIGSFAEYVENFGTPTTPMGYVAQAYLREGNLLKIVRVGSTDALEASVDIDLYPTALTSADTITGDSAGDPWVGTAANTPICPGSFSAECTEASTKITGFYAHDDGEGNITVYHATYGNIGSGTIDYSTGEITMSLANANWDIGTSVDAMYIHGAVGSNDNVSVVATSKGEWGNALTVKLVKLRENAYKDTTADFMATAFRFEIYENDVLVEVHRIDPVSGTDWLDASDMVATVNAASAYVTLTLNALASNDYVSLAPLTLTAGDDGDVNLIPADVIGTIAGDTYTGLKLFSNGETVDVNLLAAPDFAAASTGPDDLESAEYAATVAVELLSICQSRGDCMALIDPPYGYNTDEVISWHNGEAPYDDHQAFNSSFGALYWPFHKVYDAYTDGVVWIPPSGPASAIIAYSDFISEVWSAPAGLQRGRCKTSINIEMSPDLSDRELLLGLEGGSNQCVNPFVNFTNDGVVLWGQKTLQRATTSLDRVNVRRLLLYMEKLIAIVGRYLIFEPNDEKTWRQFISMAESVCGPVKSRRGLYDFRVVCDETTNTPEVIDQNKLVGKVLIKPTKTAEVITVDWTILSTGAEFTEYV